MKTKLKIALIALAGILALTMPQGCTQSEDPNPGGDSLTSSGYVIDYSTGSAIAGANVNSSLGSTQTDASGYFSLASGASDVINVTAQGYAAQSKNVNSSTSEGTNILMLPVSHSEQFDSSLPRQVIDPSSAAMVDLPANAFGAGQGQVTANLTVIDPTNEPALMPGNFTDSNGNLIESGGALDATFTDAGGNQLNLSGTTATIRIPVAGGLSNPPATMPLYYYDTVQGAWVQEGTATLSLDGTYYEGTVTHFSTWNADRPYDTATISGCVQDMDGTPISGATVTSEGSDYIGTASAQTDAQGNFTVPAKASSLALVQAQWGTYYSNTITVYTSSAGTDTPTSPCLVMGNELTAVITLDWLADPSDLDSHLTGPNADGSRFHVYFGSRGSLTAEPYANLDVDDVSGWGPEKITINNLRDGVYRYSVYHYSGISTISASARVTMEIAGFTHIFTPPGGQGALDDTWRVLEINVSGGVATVSEIGTWHNALGSTDLTIFTTNRMGNLVEKRDQTDWAW